MLLRISLRDFDNTASHENDSDCRASAANFAIHFRFPGARDLRGKRVECEDRYE
jgi:hypothetical protein